MRHWMGSWLYRDVSLIVGNLNRCRADMMSRAVDLVVDHGMGSNLVVDHGRGGDVDKRLDDWLGSCGERLCRRVDVGMEHVGNVVTTGMCCGMETLVSN
jgi:hypothetical protein